MKYGMRHVLGARNENSISSLRSVHYGSSSWTNNKGTSRNDELLKNDDASTDQSTSSGYLALVGVPKNGALLGFVRFKWDALSSYA